MSFRTPLTLERYVLRESILPFFLGFGLVTFLFYMDFLFDFLDLILAKGVPAGPVIELFVLALGWILALSVPCGVLVSALMTFGRLAQDNEITAMRGVGINVGRVMRGTRLGAALLGAALTAFNHWVLPETNHRFANLTLSIHRKRPVAKITPGIFINAFDNYSLLVKELDDKTGEMTDITIYDYSEGTVPTTILAAHGRMAYLSGGSTLRLDLEDGEVHVVPGSPSEGKYRRGRFDTHTLLLRNPGAMMERTDRQSRGEREMNVTMMLREIDTLEEQISRRVDRLDDKARDGGFDSYAAFRQTTGPPTGLAGAWDRLVRTIRRQPPPAVDPEHQPLAAAMAPDLNEIASLERNIDSYKVEIHKKFSIPFACVVFILVGAPLGIRTRKGGFANMAIAVAFFILYYLFLIGGEQLADRRIVAPALAMWLPNVVFGTLGVVLTVSVVGWGRGRGMR